MSSNANSSRQLNHRKNGDRQSASQRSCTSLTMSKRHFVSIQRRYDNLRVRDSELRKRICCECGAVLSGSEHEYQEHILMHEGVYLAYQLHYYEQLGPTANAKPEPIQPKQHSAADPPKKKQPQKRKLGERESTSVDKGTTDGHP